MDNQHKKITGYRDLAQSEIDLINEIKAKGAELEALVNRVQQMNAGHEDTNLVIQTEAVRWSAIAKTDLQTGIMALTRAVAKPQSF